MQEKLQHICLAIWQSKVTWILLFITTLIPMAVAVWQGGIQYCDSAYYLQYVAKMSEGLMPYQDIAFGYTPLWLYIAYAWGLIWGISAYTPEYFLILHFLFVVGNAVCIYFLTNHFVKNTPISLLASWLYLISSYWLEGSYIMLEVPSTFFGLLASCLIIYHGKRHKGYFILYGLFAACSFWVKQYGLGYLFLGALLIFFEEKRWQKLGLYLLGYLSTFVIAIAILGDYLWPLIFTDYGTQSAVEAGYDKSFSRVVSDWFLFLKKLIEESMLVLYFLPIVIYIPFKKRLYVREWLFCLCGFFGFSLQFIFNVSGIHYFQYLLPFAVLLMVLMGICVKHIANARFQKGMMVIYTILVVVTVVLNLNRTIRTTCFKMHLTAQVDYDIHYQQMAHQIRDIVQEDEVIWIVNSELFTIYYYGQFTPPYLQERGYSFGPLATSKEQAWASIHKADYVLALNDINRFDVFFTDSMKSYVEQYRAYAITDEITLYDMQKRINEGDDF